MFAIQKQETHKEKKNVYYVEIIFVFWMDYIVV